MKQISKYFTWQEAITSAKATEIKDPNLPSIEQTKHILIAASNLDLIREKVGPINVLSWYRSPTTNRAVGGATNSAHMDGWAIDCYSNTLTPLELCEIASKSGVVFDQIIHEYGKWMHISFHPDSRGQLLTKFAGPYKKGLLSEALYKIS